MSGRSSGSSSEDRAIDGVFAGPDESDRDRWAGTRLGAYVLEQEIGSGAMCAVYRARHVERGTQIAIKVLQSGRAAQRVYVQRLKREASVALRINHPNVIRVHEFASDPNLGPYLVME